LKNMGAVHGRAVVDYLPSPVSRPAGKKGRSGHGEPMEGAER